MREINIGYGVYYSTFIYFLSLTQLRTLEVIVLMRNKAASAL